MQSGDAVFSQVELEEWKEQLQEMGQHYQALLQDLLERMAPDAAADSIQTDMREAFQAGAESLMRNPQLLWQTQARLVQDQYQLWQQGLQALAGELGEPLVSPPKGDRRFKDEAWQQEPYYRAIMQQYLLFSGAVEELVEQLDGLPERQKRNLAFYARQLVNAMAPTNFVTTNPEVMRRTLETKGQNLVEGLAQLRRDLANSSDGLNVAMTDRSAFEIGRNIAVTPGYVVYENELIQLIQYTPTTETAFKTPLLVVPPWINKYYILDLRQDNSLVKWLVDQGHTVFLISWRNPGPEQRDLTWADYMQMGPIAAMEAIEQACGEKSVNLLSYCIGGTLAASTVAYLTSTRRGRKVKSVTYMATLQDFRDPGELGVLLSEPILQGIEARMEEDGYLDGRSMAYTFNLLRENDLFWSFYVSNYLKGENPAPFDLLYWNTDGTNLPAGTHGWYLRHMYLENRLVEPGGIELDGVRIDLRKISTPSYFVSTREDHIAKWNSTYYGALLPKGPVTFVLGGSGHIAGIVNPPARNKYGYWTNDVLPDDHEAWLEGAEFHEGSWWPHWQQWMTENGYADPDKRVPARQPGEGELKLLEEAPGRYVRMTIPEVLGEVPAKAD
ncbi:class I poly(R)-hydroxyalkanoic acid synthase [Halomonas sp. MCCC 1A17488]|uniref:Class I poly(R)-hydroxyalkanoic acid synthase n=1 Tax=Billgrantia sulfidoxydans TaxID=2733484 RepID=A0ABX7W7S8_9GAMM|nr:MULTISPECIES: class I poly(R)-hydroxyalkanoic acid synthase [Halomonas]MCE8018274.1 class I poly(R)-hydroxyalkanoic acid synthase [Halomonas sp. MCCC 1A17488]MCG3241607.1 class I poly(R)-hydroxyalkanoic acid synthase [Halomonas sp. MCCC 1A17488]QPP48446.1 class I poly(R)-hydroxyalkanoic acid synthase [Halomonas sp. SS10-MC5]QTP55757.1 class I poly(R)-hydroxyalkanoic acid synthase [Halomonas sulfidoxydans]